jgi:hypothetical protein
MRNISITTIIGLAFIGLAAEAGAGELMGDRAWNFNNQTSRASVASLMLQAENSQNGASSFGAGQACGGGGESTATANYTCIILNNSNAAIDALQDNLGDQSSNAESDVMVNSTDGGESMGDILESLAN